MAGSEEGRKVQTLVLGMKLDNSGKELLTWTLAKLANTGDHVIALHIQPLSSQPDGFKNKVEQDGDNFEWITGVHQSICSIKQVNLQVKVANNPSLKKVLVEEAKQSSATKVVLGYTSRTSQFRSSFSLAKYCAKKLPSTCSVVVIQQGEVAFEKAGTMTNPDSPSRVLSTIQKIRNHSRRKSIDTKVSFVYQPSYKDIPIVADKIQSAMSRGPFHRFLDTQAFVADKIPNKISLKKISDESCQLKLSASIAPRNYSSSEMVLNEDDLQQRCQSLPEHYSKEAPELECFSNREASGTSEKPSQDMSEITLEDRIDNSPGWPLMRQSVMSKAHSNRIRSHKLSVVEWALQLPDRPKEILNQHSDDSTKEDQSSYVVSPSSPATQSNDGYTVASRIERICQDKPCKEFHLIELQVATDNFSMNNVIGKGGCSNVYQGLLSDGRLVAVKCLNASTPDSEEEFLTEVEIISGLHHSHIVQFIGYCVDTQNLFLVYNFASEGNLEQKLHGGKGKMVLPWDARHKVAVGVAQALKYLHDDCVRPVIHRDVKSSNILLSKDLQPQLTDFGLAKWIPATTSQITCSDVVGTFGYLAPEYFMFGKVSEKTDVYSFGVVLLELITGRRPIDNTNPKGEQNLVAWAKPLLDDLSNVESFIDPNLDGLYNEVQVKHMIIAAGLCIRQAPQLRPRMIRILKLLKGEIDDLECISKQDATSKDIDDDFDVANYGDTDIRTHLTLALLGLDDDAVSQDSTDQSINLSHSNKFLMEYLGGRYSRSSSFE